MSALTNKLSELSSSLNIYATEDYFKLEPIKMVLNQVGKSFSGSWLGYHSQVYYKNFKTPIAGAIFSVEWGLEQQYGITGTTGEWHIYNYDDVIKYILKTSGIEDIEALNKASSSIAKLFESTKESLLSLISIYSSSNSDNDIYYQEVIEEIRNCKLIKSSDYIAYYKPKGRLASRDSRATMNGIQTPAHISLLGNLLEIEDPIRCCNQLNESIKKLITHYTNKELLSMPTSKMTLSNKIFIVHGHDDLAKTEVARFIEKLGLEAIILHEQVDAGRTIIEKLEKNTEVGFGIVLYTACDFGGSNKINPEIKNNRARQNVVFEHGYLIAKLGRSKVCALVKDNVEHPSDLSGVIYNTMDDGKAWKLELAQELKVAGFDIDLNKCI